MNGTKAMRKGAAVAALALCVAGPGHAATSLCSHIGYPYPLFDWRFVSPGAPPQTHAYYMLEDTVTVTIENSSTLTADQIQVTLVSDVGWRKRITARNLDTCAIGPFVETNGNSRGPVSMILTRGSFDTVVLWKAKTWGDMTAMYYFDSDVFWKLWAGKSITIRWVNDYFTFGQPSCSFPCIPVQTDPAAGVFFDPNPSVDFTVFRPGSGVWYTMSSVTGTMREKQWGTFGDVPVPRDYDSDGTTDVAVWRPSSGEWFIIHSLTGATRVERWGLPGDIPVPADYDGDSKADIAVWRPATGEWWVIPSSGFSSQGTVLARWGLPGDVPVPGNYDPDGRADVAIWRPSTGVWWIMNNRTQQWGAPGDIPVPADYDGDLVTDMAVWRPHTGEWWVVPSMTGVGTMVRRWGLPGDVPVPGWFAGLTVPEWNRARLAVWRPTTGTWHVIDALGGQRTVQWGLYGDVPVPTK